MTIWISGGREFQEEGTASAKTKRQEYTWAILGTSNRPVWLEQSGQKGQIRKGWELPDRPLGRSEVLF